MHEAMKWNRVLARIAAKWTYFADKDSRQMVSAIHPEDQP
jgi:hypothetical protein